MKKEPVFWCNGEGEQSRVYFKVHLDFISSKHHELRKQGEEPPVLQFSSPSPFPGAALEYLEGLGDHGGRKSCPPQSLTARAERVV